MAALYRQTLVVATAASISASFGSPLGGVIFVLEELDLFTLPENTLWNAFIGSIVAAFASQYLNIFKSSAIQNALFSVTVDAPWQLFELVCHSSLRRIA